MKHPAVRKKNNLIIYYFGITGLTRGYKMYHSWRLFDAQKIRYCLSLNKILVNVCCSPVLFPLGRERGEQHPQWELTPPNALHSNFNCAKQWPGDHAPDSLPYQSPLCRSMCCKIAFREEAKMQGLPFFHYTKNGINRTKNRYFCTNYFTGSVLNLI